MNKRLHVLYYNRAINATEGPAIHAREILNALRGLNVDITNYPKPTKDMFYAKKIFYGKNTTPPIRLFKESLRFLRGSVYTLKDFCYLSYYIIKYRIDFILTRSFEFNIAAFLAQKIYRVPVIIEINALGYLEQSARSVAFYVAVRKFIEKLNIENATAAYVVSAGLVTILEKEKISPKVISIIPNGVDTERFNREVLPNKQMKALVKPENVVIGFVGSLQRWHGVDLLINGFSLIHKEYPLAVLMIVGDGNQRESLEAIVKDLGIQDRVIFTGSISHEEVPSYVAAFDIGVAPYRSGGTFYFSPLKVFEYMAMGKPVIASSLGQIEDIIKTGKHGILVSPDSAEALSEACCVLLADAAKIKDMGDAAFYEASNRYSWTSASQKIFELYRKAVAV